MHLKRKGFTLIELLAVILILGIISAIAISVSFKIVAEIKYNSYLEDRHGFEKALEQYLTFKEDKLPTEVGQTITIELDELVDDGRIKKISNPFGKGNCTGYALITKLDNGENDINTHLICNPNVASVADDKLVAHYKFEEFQEPTTNLSSGRLGSMGQLDLIYKGIENGYHKYGLSGTWNDGNYPYSMLFPIYNYPGHVPFSVSVRIKTNVKEKFSNFGNLNVVNDEFMYGTMKDINDGEFFSRVDFIHSKDYRNNVYVVSMPKSNGTTFNPDTDFVYYKDYQIEQKSYTTPYVEGSRIGKIKDYSNNDRPINLEESKTPRWVKGGYYNFNGKTTEMLIPNLNLTKKKITVSMWVKPSTTEDGTAVIIAPQSEDRDQMLKYNYDSENIVVNIAQSTDTNEREYYTKTRSMKKGKWSHVTLVLDNNMVKVYINGEKQLEGTSDTGIALWSGDWLVGARGTSVVSAVRKRFNGDLDNIQINERVLSDQEIEINYMDSANLKKYN